MTSRSRAGLAVLAAWVASVPAFAQETNAAAARADAVVETPAVECGAGPLRVVARFLGLRAEQVTAVAQLLQARQATLAPILEAIAHAEQRIRDLIETGGDPAEIGGLMIEIHHLRQAAEAAQAQFLAGFQAVLDDEQRPRWQQVRMAAPLMPILPAFVELRIL